MESVSRLGRGVWWLFIGIVVVWGLAALSLDLVGGRTVGSSSYDAVVVAGAGVRPGGVPSGTLIRRTRRAVELVTGGHGRRLALTGGVGDWPPAEAVVARQLALGWGVPPGSIVWEDRSTSTEENAREIRAVLGDARILVVTDRSHVVRCERVFRRYFREVDAVGVAPPLSARIYGALREVLAVSYYGVLGRL
ncbi:MAG TPA: YdcF family protein [Deltaproteobacteria bacterium]|nr:YdcF family protein [Deltaproteobacteria bacterium]